MKKCVRLPKTKLIISVTGQHFVRSSVYHRNREISDELRIENQFQLRIIGLIFG